MPSGLSRPFATCIHLVVFPHLPALQIDELRRHFLTGSLTPEQAALQTRFPTLMAKVNSFI